MVAIDIPCKPLPNTKHSKTNKNETLDKDGSECNLVGYHS